jgi:hypothetical protein
MLLLLSLSAGLASMQSFDSKRDTASASLAFAAAVNLSSTARAWSSAVAGVGDAGAVSCRRKGQNISPNETAFDGILDVA